MENRTLFLLFLIAWAVCVPVMYVVSIHLRASLRFVTLAHIVPTIVALVMAGIFLVGNGATVAQFAAGSQSATNLSTLWGVLWFLFLPVTFGSSVLLFGATCFAAVRARRYLMATVLGLGLSILALFTVAANFPDA